MFRRASVLDEQEVDNQRGRGDDLQKDCSDDNGLGPSESRQHISETGASCGHWRVASAISQGANCRWTRRGVRASAIAGATGADAKMPSQILLNLVLVVVARSTQCNALR